jgi:hypothetical protein
MTESVRGDSKCPKCGNLVDGVGVVRYNSSFACPTCMTELRVPGCFKLIMYVINMGVSYFLCTSLGFRGEGFLVGFFVFVVPSLFTVSIVLRKISPPKLVVDDSSPFS